ncbi:hypothetical protein [Trueperella sp. LYQ143]
MLRRIAAHSNIPAGWSLGTASKLVKPASGFQMEIESDEKRGEYGAGIR